MPPRPKPRRVLRSETIRRREAHAEAEREIVLASATALFSTRGYHETSIRDIANRAGFSIGALYQRFVSKDALYCEVVEKHYGQIWDAVDRAVAANDAFAPRLVGLTQAIFTHIATNRTFLRLYELHPPTIAEPYKSKIAQHRAAERSRRAIVEAFARGHRDGVIGSRDAELLGTAYYGILSRLMIDFLANRRELPDPEQIVQLFVQGAARRTTGRGRLRPSRPFRPSHPA